MQAKVQNDIKILMQEKRYVPVCEFIKNTNLLALETGEHQITDDVYVLVSEYETKENKPNKYEAHRKYDDIQMIIIGEENIKCEDLGACTPITEYDEDGDYILLTAKDGKDKVLKAGDFIILPPDCAHLPGCAVDKAIKVKKAVFKVKI